MKKTNDKNNIRLVSDNQGSTLVIVLVCMFFVSIVAAMILSVTMMNMDMKAVEEKASENFYDTEGIMEEFTTDLRQKVTTAFKESYESMLENYLDTADADRKSEFYKKLKEELQIDGSNNSVLISGWITAIGGDTLPEGAVSINTVTGTITIHDVSITYQDGGYDTSITTDIIIDITYPDINMNYDLESDGLYDSEYVIISNGTVRTGLDSSTALGGQVTLSGNLYAGKDILINSSPTAISSYKIIAGETLNVSRLATAAVVMGTDTGTDNGLWARNVDIAGGTFVYSGNSYIADDLTLSASGSNVTLTNGEYYGYLFSDKAEADPSKSSSIVINQGNIRLDLSGLTKLWLAGNTYISEADLFADTGLSTAAAGIMQGESIAYKNMQAAYLIPGACFVGVGHNPVLATDTVKINGTDYLATTELTDADKTDGVYIDVELNKSAGGIMLEKYVDPADPYIQRSVATTNGTNMTYYYLKFKNAKCAADYYQEFITTVRGQAIMAQINNLGAQSVISYPADASKIYTMGNIIAYNGTDQYSLFQDTIASGLTLLPVKNSMTQKFNALLLRLSSTEASMIPSSDVIDSDSTDMFGYLINTSLLQTNFSSSSGERHDVTTIHNAETNTDTVYYLSAAYFTNGVGTVTVPRDENWTNTVIITNGDVEVYGNFSGLIIAGGDVLVSSYATLVETSDVKLNELVANPDIGKYFNVYNNSTQTGGSSINVESSIQISYQNWNKN